MWPFNDNFLHFISFPKLEDRIEGLYDPDERLDHNSHLIDGTHITNFSSDRFEKYRLALEKYNDPNLVISNYAYSSDGTFLEGMRSLHHMVKGDLSDFWRVFDDIDKQKPHSPEDNTNTPN